MAGKQQRDWTRAGTVEGFAAYLRQQADAFVVLVLRRDDAVLLVDPALAPKDAAQLIERNLPELVAGVEAARREKGKGARVHWGELHE